MEKIRKYGEGSIRQRKDGRWEGRFTCGFDYDSGKYLSRSIMGKTYDEVSERLKSALSESDKSKCIGTDNITMADWMTIWFETYSKPIIRESTAISYSSQMKNHIFPAIGEIILTALTSHDIQLMYNRISAFGRLRTSEKTGLSSRTIRSIHSLLHQCLSQAVQEHRIAYNPADACKLPALEQTEMKVMHPETVGIYLNVAKQHGALAMLFLALCSGLRRGELLALQWSDLNVDNSSISVTKQVTGRKGSLVISAPKTPNSIRTIAIPKQAVELLLSEREKNPGNPYMFPSPKTGYMYYPDSVGRLHKKILETAGLERIRFHDLRHTFATLAIQNGVDIKTLSNMLGHCSVGFTLDTYAHVTEKMQRDAANKMGKFMKGFVLV